jgi:guanylate kinase
MENKEHILLCVIGRTASGKDSLVGKLCERTGLKQLISYTTRERRNGEGDTHLFVSEEEYHMMLADSQVAVDTNIAGNYYWSTIEQLYETDVYVIDYIGLKKLRELNLPNIRLVSIFINTPDEIREARALRLRKDDKAKFRVRNFSEASQFRDMLKNADFDYAISNIEWSKAYSVLRWVATVEGIWKNNVEEEIE